MIVDEPPSFALHHWIDGALRSHIDVAANYTVFARHDERTKALVASLIAERHDPQSHASA